VGLIRGENRSKTTLDFAGESLLRGGIITDGSFGACRPAVVTDASLVADTITYTETKTKVKNGRTTTKSKTKTKVVGSN
jgi:hypothetical protein